MVYRVAGLMSGTSLDGLDLVFCTFSKNKGSWSYELHHGITVPFPATLQKLLSQAHLLVPESLVSLDRTFGGWCGEVVAREADHARFVPLLIASHGHTIFHRPDQGVTLQIGHGDVMAKASGYPVVHDFRSADLFLGGQGAPLVPVGDRLLFPGFNGCLNLGGIANISFQRNGRREAFDICPVNQLLNHLAVREGVPFDRNGMMAAKGKIIPSLTAKLDAIEYYKYPAPKSLSREMVETFWIPLLDYTHPTADLLYTVCDHIAQQVTKASGAISGRKLLVTGGGAFNEHLMGELCKYSNLEIVIPDEATINFKEALVFAFLGLLRWLGESNVYGSATGAIRDHCSGLISLP